MAFLFDRRDPNIKESGFIFNSVIIKSETKMNS